MGLQGTGHSNLSQFCSKHSPNWFPFLCLMIFRLCFPAHWVWRRQYCLKQGGTSQTLQRAPGLHLLSWSCPCLISLFVFFLMSSLSAAVPHTIWSVCIYIYTYKCRKSQISKPLNLWLLQSSGIWKGRRGSELLALHCHHGLSVVNPLKRKVMRIIRTK